jgi:hypothetical protein
MQGEWRKQGGGEWQEVVHTRSSLEEWLARHFAIGEVGESEHGLVVAVNIIIIVQARFDSRLSGCLPRPGGRMKTLVCLVQSMWALG